MHGRESSVRTGDGRCPGAVPAAAGGITAVLGRGSLPGAPHRAPAGLPGPPGCVGQAEREAGAGDAACSPVTAPSLRLCSPRPGAEPDSLLLSACLKHCPGAGVRPCVCTSDPVSLCLSRTGGLGGGSLVDHRAERWWESPVVFSC